LPDAERGKFLARQTPFPAMSNLAQAALLTHLEDVRAQGYESARSEQTAGVSDLAVLIGSETSKTQAALAVAALSEDHDAFVLAHHDALRRHAAGISRTIGILLPSKPQAYTH
jgi:DNA-binding IclR family transcriptional regulator